MAALSDEQARECAQIVADALKDAGLTDQARHSSLDDMTRLIESLMGVVLPVVVINLVSGMLGGMVRR